MNVSVALVMLSKLESFYNHIKVIIVMVFVTCNISTYHKCNHIFIPTAFKFGLTLSI